MGTLQTAVVERARGERPSRVKSTLAAGTVGLAAAALTYRLLRRPGTAEETE